jgi:outer membrane protein TolC
MKTLLIGIVTLLFTISGSAQELLTLDRAVSIALEQNHMLRGATHDVEAAQWGKRNAISYFLPKVELSSDYTRIDPATDRRANAAIDFIKASAGTLGIPPSMLADLKPFAYRNEYSTNLTVVQPIYNGGAEIVGMKAADAVMDRSEYSFQDAEQDVIARVKYSYFEILKAEALVSLAKESAERTNRWLEMTRRRASLGSRTNTDVLRFQVQLAADEGNIVSAENYLAAARLGLNELLGEDLQKSYRLQEIVSVDSMISSNIGAAPVFQFASLQMPVETSTLSEAFLEAHPSMRTMEANLRLADINVSKSWVNFKPRVNLAFQYGWEKNNTLRLDGIRPWAFSLSVSLPIFNGFGDYTNLQRAHAEYDRTKEQVESFRRGLLMQATNAQLKLKSTKKRIEIAKIGLQQGLEVLNSVSRRYDAGASSNVDLIDVQTAYTSAKTNYITAMYDNYIAEVELARATGTISH